MKIILLIFVFGLFGCATNKPIFEQNNDTKSGWINSQRGIMYCTLIDDKPYCYIPSYKVPK